MTAKDSGPKARSRVSSLLRTAGGTVGRVTGGKSMDSEADSQSSTEPTAAAAAPRRARKSAAPAAVAAKATAPKKTTRTAEPAAKKTAAKPISRSGNAEAPLTVGKAADAATPVAQRRTSTRTSPVTKKVTVKKTLQAAPVDLVVREDESPWTAAELEEVRAELVGDVDRLEAELRSIEADIAGLIKDSSSGAGDDQADVGSKAFERDHEYTLAQNNRSSLAQAQHALERIEDGTFGVCENCGKPIGKMRLQAFPRATLCMACKQKERR
ncbi:TraR/DksA family transcriptional regulator [Calidifontibacter terrae]